MRYIYLHVIVRLSGVAMNRFNFSISRVWFIVGLFAIAEGLLWNEYRVATPSGREVLAFAATVVAGTFALYSYLKGQEQRRDEAADRLIARWSEPSMIPLRKFIREVSECQVELGDICRDKRNSKLPTQALEKRSDVVAILGFLEEIALAIRTGTASEGKLRRYYEAVLMQSWQAVEEWVKSERRVDNEPGYFLELEIISQRWSQMRAKAVERPA
jgi:Domain of unknown function (DUF4760)